MPSTRNKLIQKNFQISLVIASIGDAAILTRKQLQPPQYFNFVLTANPFIKNCCDCFSCFCDQMHDRHNWREERLIWTHSLEDGVSNTWERLCLLQRAFVAWLVHISFLDQKAESLCWKRNWATIVKDLLLVTQLYQSCLLPQRFHSLPNQRH